jgi:hypothetical protein
MSRQMKGRKRTPGAVDPAKVVGPPTQSQGIREAQAEKHPSDPTKKVHADSVPLAGAVQPSRFDAVMPSAEPVQPDERSGEDAEADEPGETRATIGNPNR